MDYPTGLQSFAEVRASGCVYVDKTRFIYDLADLGKYFFLRRPPQFGKSLFLSALEEYFSGNRALFEGLDIARLEPGDWARHPVFRINLGAQTFDSDRAPDDLLNACLDRWSREYGVADRGESAVVRLGRVIDAAVATTGRKAVVLVDDFDEPMTDLVRAIRANDRNIRFAMFTATGGKAPEGVRDISLEPRFSSICGFTEEEIGDNYPTDLERLAAGMRATPRDAFAMLKSYYGRYRFAGDLTDIYCPAALLSAFESGEIGGYRQLPSLTPRALRAVSECGRPIAEFAGTECDATVLSDTDCPEAQLYASGYLTIRGYDPCMRTFVIGYPNREMKAGLMRQLLPLLTAVGEAGYATELVIRLARALTDDDLGKFFETLRLFFDGPEVKPQDAVYCLATLLGEYLQAEQRRSPKPDCSEMAVATRTKVYLFELDFSGRTATPEATVDIRCFDLPFPTDGRPVVKVAAIFSADGRKVGAWAATDV